MFTLGSSSSPVEVSGIGLSCSHCLYSGVLLTVIIILALRTSEVAPPFDFLLLVIGKDAALSAADGAVKCELCICPSTPVVEDDVTVSVEAVGIDFNGSCVICAPDSVEVVEMWAVGDFLRFGSTATYDVCILICH